VRLADNGGGMESSPRKSRFGLTGMRERVEMAGGTFTIESAPGLGLCLEAHLPVSEEK
jgi:signal transduction histidine kinase